MPRSIFGPYGRILRVPGSAGFVVAGFFGRFPRASLSLSTVLLVGAESDSFGIAGAVAGVLVLAMAVSGPLWSRAMDRVGQQRILLIILPLLLVTAVALMVAVTSNSPTWLWFVLAIATGLSAPDIGSAVRSRWSSVISTPADRHTAFSLESVADEFTFVVSPPIVTVLAAAVSPVLGFSAALTIGTVGIVGLLLQSGTQPSIVPRAERVRTSRRPPIGVLTVVLVCVGVGVVFGSFDVTAVAFATAAKAPAVAGFTIGAFGLGSAVSAVLFGSRQWKSSLSGRFIGSALFMALLIPSLLLATTPATLIVAAFVAGLAVAPVLISAMSVAQSRAPEGRVTEILAYPSVGLSIGVTLGASLAGSIFDASGYTAAFLLTAAGAAAVAILAIASEAILRGFARPAQQLSANS